MERVFSQAGYVRVVEEFHSPALAVTGTAPVTGGDPESQAAMPAACPAAIACANTRRRIGHSHAMIGRYDSIHLILTCIFP